MTKFIFMFKVKCYIKKTNSHSEILFVFLMFIPAGLSDILFICFVTVKYSSFVEFCLCSNPTLQGVQNSLPTLS